MSKKAPKRRSPQFIVFSWLSALMSAGLLYLMGRMAVSNFSQFRSCDSNNTGLVIQACGKQSFNFGDLLILFLFVLSACLAVSLFTASWRMVRSHK